MMKTSQVICAVIFKGLLPLVLLAATAVRFNGLSLMYGCLMLVAPLLPNPTPLSMRGHTGRYLIVTVVLCTIALLAQVVFQVFLLVKSVTSGQPYGAILPNCSDKESILRQFGLQRVETNDPANIVRVVLPDIVAFAISLIVYLVCRKLTPPISPNELPISAVRTRVQRRTNTYLVYVGHFFVLLFLAASGIAYPTVLSAVYFLTFLAVSTWLACSRTLGIKFAFLRITLFTFSAIHLILVYLYQFQFFQTAVSSKSLLARLLGLTALVTTDCRKPWLVHINDKALWPMFASPAVIVVLNYVLAVETCRWYTRKYLEVVEATEEQEDEGDPESVARKKLPKRKHSTDSERQSLVTDTGSLNYGSTSPARTPSTEATGADIEELEQDVHVEQEIKDPCAPKKRNPFLSIFVYVVRQSYIFTLIAMMAWSITYHSWLTFVMLLTACIVWMTPESRRACLFLSPLIVIYAIALLLIQFVYGLNLTDSELPVVTPSGYKYSEIGLTKYQYPCIELAIQSLFTVMFWLTLMQHIGEARKLRQQGNMPGMVLEPVESGSQESPPKTAQPKLRERQMSSVDVVDGYDSHAIKAVGTWFWHALCKYWIFVCGAMFLVMALQEAVLYRIIYLVLFLYFVLSFQLSYRWWRVSIYVFWWVVIVYSMLVLCLIYTYQFDMFPGLWHNGTGMSYDMLADIGLEQFTTATLFVKLLTPTSFLVVIILQLHYFQKPFLYMSDINRFRLESSLVVTNPQAEHDDPDEGAEEHPPDGTTEGETAGQDEEQDQDVPDGAHKPKGLRLKLKLFFHQVWQKSDQLVERFSAIVWRILEIHVIKAVLFTIFMVCAAEVNAINVVFLVFLLIGTPVPQLQGIMSHLCQCWVGLVLLVKTVYQLRLVPSNQFTTNCTIGNESMPDLPEPFNKPIDNAVYIGLEKTHNLSNYVKNYIFICLILVFEAIVKVHQAQFWAPPYNQKPKHGIIFSDVTRANADNDLLSAIKFLANYTYYKFGLEICYIMTVITICVRLDAYSLLYAIFLGVLLCLNRRGNLLIWPIYILVLTVLLLLQYLSCLGVPPGLCWVYPWDSDKSLPANLKTWLFLPNYTHSPDSYKLIADFFQLLFACLQWRVLYLENSNQAEAYGGGNNRSVLTDVEQNLENPVEDFTTSRDSYLDYIKAGVFMYLYWVTLVIVFIAATTRISLFCMGYMVGVFFMLWFGQELLLKPLRRLLRLWGILLAYNFFVILCKSTLQLVGCVYMDKLTNECWLVQLLSIVCLNQGSYYNKPTTNDRCELPEDEAGLTWDVVCFVFLLIQMRVFKTHYFRHVVTELEIQNKLAARGAELINTNLIRGVEERKKLEAETLANVKMKMKRIRERQEKVKHIVAYDEHYQVIRSGDYYMFEDDSEEEEDDSEEKKTPEDKDKDKADPLKIINTALKKGTKEALEEHEERHEEDEKKGSHSGDEGGEGQVVKKTDEDAGPSTEGEQKKDSLWTKIVNQLKLGWALICRLLDYVIATLKGISREYRMVAHRLDKEKEIEKKRLRREGHPTTASTEDEVNPEDTHTEALTTGERDRLGDLEDVALELKKTDTEDPTDAEWRKEEEFHDSSPRIFQLVVALYDVLISHSEIVCYFAMILNHLVSASLLSIVYPISVFLWAMLSVPRPTKTYWITIITYTEAVVVVKYLFQFGFFPWNSNTQIVEYQKSPFWPPRILGIEKRDMYAAFDLILLFVLFIHRTVLKRYGLWRDTVDVEEDLKKAEVKEASSRTTSMAEPPADVDSPTSELGATNEVFEMSSGELGQVAPQDCDKKGGDKKKGAGFCANFLKPFTDFYKQMTNPKYNAVTDVYAIMFLCDFIAFIIVVFGYWAFGPVDTSGGGDVAQVFQTNRVPVPFLVMLLVQFVLIIVDRALYLRKQVFGKFIFQIILVIGVHLWLFFILPAVTRRKFTDNLPAQLWYFTKCVYFGLSAYQIRSGYPTRILGNFLTKKYNYSNLFLFKGFLIVPFLLELRALMDWIWTDTTLSISSWLEMEDIYANIFVLKCWRRAETDYPTPRGTSRKAIVKYGVGGLLLFILIFIIWFPLVLFSLSNTVFVSNPPIDCTVKLTFGGYQPIFTAIAERSNLSTISEYQLTSLKKRFSDDPRALAFLTSYRQEDISVVTLSGQSGAVWGISPPSYTSLEKDLNGAHGINIYFDVSFTRKSVPGVATETVSNQFSKVLGSDESHELAMMLKGNYTNTTQINNLFPGFMSVPATGRPKEASRLFGAGGAKYSSITLQLQTRNTQRWWKLQEVINHPGSPPVFKDELKIIAFSDRVAPAILSFLNSYGIIGLYISFILVIGQFVRLRTSGLTANIMFEELPYVDRVYKLCMDIYLVREVNELFLEEELYAKLLFLYRSPETMIRWTRPPKEKED